MASPNRSTSPGLIVAVIVWSIGNLILICIGYGVVYLMAMSVASCGPSHGCDIPLVTATVTGLPIDGVIIAAVTGVGSVVLNVRQRSILLAPAAGTILTIASVAAAMGLSYSATA